MLKVPTNENKIFKNIKYIPEFSSELRRVLPLLPTIPGGTLHFFGAFLVSSFFSTALTKWPFLSFFTLPKCFDYGNKFILATIFFIYSTYYLL